MIQAEIKAERNGKHNEHIHGETKRNYKLLDNKNEPIRKWHWIKAMECVCL